MPILCGKCALKFYYTYVKMLSSISLYSHMIENLLLYFEDSDVRECNLYEYEEWCFVSDRYANTTVWTSVDGESEPAVPGSDVRVRAVWEVHN